MERVEWSGRLLSPAAAAPHLSSPLVSSPLLQLLRGVGCSLSEGCSLRGVGCSLRGLHSGVLTQGSSLRGLHLAPHATRVDRGSTYIHTCYNNVCVCEGALIEESKEECVELQTEMMVSDE
jgi:hypothetical protein